MAVLGALSIVFALVTGFREALVGGTILLAAPPLAWWTLLAWKPRFAVHRVLDTDVVAVGERVLVTVRIRNLSEHPHAAATFHDVLSGGLEGPAVSELPALDQRRLGETFGPDSAVVRIPVRAVRRGAASIGPLVIEGRDPFGLAAAAYPLGPVQQVLVTPRVTALPAGPVGDEPASDQDGPRQDRRSAPNPDELIARPYQPGDSLRRVHWRATAKQDELMVRQEEWQSTASAVVYFDARRPAHQAGALPDPSFETAVELVSSVAVLLVDSGYEVWMVTNARRAEAPDVRRGGARGPSPRPASRLELPYPGESADEATFRERVLAGLALAAPAPPDAEDRLDEVGAVLARAATAVPLVAVVCAGDERWLSRLGSLSEAGRPALAFVAGAPALPVDSAPSARVSGLYAEGDVADGLRGDGWSSVVVPRGGSVYQAWAHVSASILWSGPRSVLEGSVARYDMRGGEQP
jgi:uncharacterized repeat protein (TIGR01451 family)